MTIKAKTKGLAGISAGETAICDIGEQGTGLTYRGYSIYDLSEQGSFEETAYLLIHDKLPPLRELQSYKSRLASMRGIPDGLKRILETLPSSAHPMDVLRTATSALGSFEPESGENDQYRIADRLLACMPYMLVYWLYYHRNGSRISEESAEDDIAGHLLALLHGRPPGSLQRRALEVALILYVEHEFNASTFSARITASTLSDFYSAITSAIGTLRGPLHGGANEEVMKMLAHLGTREDAEREVLRILSRKERVMGFGHRIYKQEDPRAAIMKEWSRRLSEAANDMRVFRISERIEQVMLREKNLYPNMDFYSASVFDMCGIPPNFFTAIFVFARITGWSAHIIEQRRENRLIRPSADYIGPGHLAYVNLEERT